jgi:hypothetical protein
MERNGTKIGKLNMLEALEKSLGIVTNALKLSNTAKTTYHRWINEDEAFAKAVKDVGNTALDFAESKLFSQIKDNNHSSTQFYLKNKGRDRGYGDKLDITTGGDKINKIEIEIVKSKDKD